jgi:hypothetical protein
VTLTVRRRRHRPTASGASAGGPRSAWCRTDSEAASRTVQPEPTPVQRGELSSRNRE